MAPPCTSYIFYSFDKSYPFHFTSFEHCISFKSCKCNVLEIWINHKTRTSFLDFFLAIIASFSPFWPFYRPRFPYPPYPASKLSRSLRNTRNPRGAYPPRNSLSFHLPEAWKRYPFRADRKPVSLQLWRTIQLLKNADDAVLNKAVRHLIAYSGKNIFSSSYSFSPYLTG